jgi:hypothetical protein
VQQIGYRIAPAKHGFEIEGVADDVLRRFSKRSQQRDEVVNEMEERLGRKLSNNEISHAVHQSRAKIIKGISTAEVRQRQLMPSCCVRASPIPAPDWLRLKPCPPGNNATFSKLFCTGAIVF